MAAGSIRACPGPFMDVFLLSSTFQTYLIKSMCLFVDEEQAVGPGVLQTFSTCAVMP